MSAAPVRLDMSTAQPISSGVKLDMSTVQPIAGTQPSLLDRMGNGLQKPIQISGMPNTSRQLNEVKDLALGAAKNTATDVYNIGPGFLAQQWNKWTGGNAPIPTPSAEDVTRAAKNVGISAMLGAPEAMEAEGAAAASRVPRTQPLTASRPSAAQAVTEAPGRAMRVGKVVARRIPGVRLAGDLLAWRVERVPKFLYAVSVGNSRDLFRLLSVQLKL